MDETDGFVKLLADKSTGEILGASAVGPDASNWSMKSWSRCASAPQPVNLPPSLIIIPHSVRFGFIPRRIA